MTSPRSRLPRSPRAARCPPRSRVPSTSTGRRPRRSPAARSRTPRRSRRCGSPAGWPPRPASWSASHVAPGVTTDELDRIGHEFLCDHGAYPSTLGYSGFPKSLCSSVNEVICHGIPDSPVVEDGDIVNIDITAYLDGVHGDTNATFLRRRRRRGDRGCWWSAPSEALRPRDQGGAAGPPDQRHRPRHRVVRPSLRLRRGPRVHRARHRHMLLPNPKIESPMPILANFWHFRRDRIFASYSLFSPLNMTPVTCSSLFAFSAACNLQSWTCTGRPFTDFVDADPAHPENALERCDVPWEVCRL